MHNCRCGVTLLERVLDLFVTHFLDSVLGLGSCPGPSPYRTAKINRSVLHCHHCDDPIAGGTVHWAYDCTLNRRTIGHMLRLGWWEPEARFHEPCWVTTGAVGAVVAPRGRRRTTGA